MKVIRVGLIGSQFMGIAHSNAFKNLAMWTKLPVKVVLKCVCSTGTNGTLKDFAERFGWEEYEIDWKKVITRNDIDVISIGAPNNLHSEIAIAAAQNNKHVLCEKPMANTITDAEKMLRAVEDAGVKHCCGFSYRFTPSLALARQLVAEGRLGRIYHVFARYAQDWIADPNFGMVWRFKKSIAGSGSLGDLGAHSIDAARFITGLSFTDVIANMKTLITERPVDNAQPDGRKEKVSVDDVAQFLVNFDNGATGCFEATRLASGRKNYNSIEVNGEKGSLVWNFEDQNYLMFYDSQQSHSEAGFKRINVTHDVHPYSGGWWPQGHGIGYSDTFIIEIAEFFKSIIDDSSFSPDFRDGLECQKVLHAIEQSVEKKCWIKIDS